MNYQYDVIQTTKEVLQCIQCKQSKQDDFLFALCCLEHQFCAKCTSSILNQKSTWQTCHCCPRFPVYQYSTVPEKKRYKTSKIPFKVGPVNQFEIELQPYEYREDIDICQNIQKLNFHELDYFCFPKSEYIDVLGFSEKMIYEKYIGTDKEDFNIYVRMTDYDKLEKEHYYHKIQVPIICQGIEYKNPEKITYFVKDQPDIDDNGFVTQYTINQSLRSLQQTVSCMIMNVLNSVGQPKSVNSQLLVDYVLSSRNKIKECISNKQYFKIRMFRTLNQLIITLIESKTGLPVSQK